MSRPSEFGVDVPRLRSDPGPVPNSPIAVNHWRENMDASSRGLHGVSDLLLKPG